MGNVMPEKAVTLPEVPKVDIKMPEEGGGCEIVQRCCPVAQQQVFKHLHGTAHPGRRATRRLISSRYVWKGLSTDVTAWAASGPRSTATCRTDTPATHFGTHPPFRSPDSHNIRLRDPVHLLPVGRPLQLAQNPAQLDYCPTTRRPTER